MKAKQHSIFVSISKRGWWAKYTLILTVSVLATVLIVAAVGAAGHAETVIQFDPTLGELPEGVTVDKIGNVFVSLSPLGQLVKVAPGSHTAEPFGVVPGLVPDDFGLLGLNVDAPGNVYGTVVSANPDAQGVWKFDRRSGASERVPGTGAITFPNSVAFDKRGTMYVTDTIIGAVWRVPRGGMAEPWIVDPLLAGDGSAGFPFPIGANGIAVRHNTVYVGVTETALIVTVPILPDGSAGTPMVHADLFSAGVAVDGIALDVHGNVYVANPLANSVVRANSDGSVETLADVSDGLDVPTSVAFGTGAGNKQSVYAVNFSVALGGPLIHGPGLVKIDVGVPGQPVP